MGDHETDGREGLTPDAPPCPRHHLLEENISRIKAADPSGADDAIEPQDQASDAAVKRAGRPRSVALWLPEHHLVYARSIVPRDAAHLRSGLARMSEQSRHQRFMTEINDLTAQELQLLTTLDYKSRMAWGVVDWTQGCAKRGVGVGRYMALPSDPGAAEVALAIVDSHQRRGVGLYLMALLVRSGLTNAITRFTGHMLAENDGMRRLVDRLGGSLSRPSAGVVELSLDLSRAAACLDSLFAGDWRFTRVLRRRTESMSVKKDGA